MARFININGRFVNADHIEEIFRTGMENRCNVRFSSGYVHTYELSPLEMMKAITGQELTASEIEDME